MATALPCDAGRCFWQPSAAEETRLTSSAKRRMRDRRSTIRHSQRQSSEVKKYLLEGPRHSVLSFAALQADADEFMPRVDLVLAALEESGINTGNSQLEGTNAFVTAYQYEGVDRVMEPGHLHPETGSVGQTRVAATRRSTQSECTAEQLPALPCADVDSIVVNQIYVPGRKCLTETCLAEVLPFVVTPPPGQCTVVADAANVQLEKGEKLHLAKPARVFKQQSANKTLRGLDVAAIGDGKAVSDNPMLAEGVVTVLESGFARVKVAGYARASSGGAVHFVRGWIDNAAIDKDAG